MLTTQSLKEPTHPHQEFIWGKQHSTEIIAKVPMTTILGTENIIQGTVTVIETTTVGVDIAPGPIHHEVVTESSDAS